MPKTTQDIFTAFFDGGKHRNLFMGQGAQLCVSVGEVSGTQAVAVAQNGGALDAADIKRWINAIHLAGKTGVPLFTFFASVGAVLEGGTAPLTGFKEILKASSKISGLVPQIAVVLGVCGGNCAIVAAMADICIMSEEGELFLTPPFTSAAGGNKTKDAGSAKQAAESDVAHIIAKDFSEAIADAKKLALLLPSNNLTVTSVFDFTAPTTAFSTIGYTPQRAAGAIADEGSLLPVFENIVSIYAALATVNGNAIGLVVTSNEKGICKKGVAKAARFVRLCDVYNIPVVTVVSCEGFEKTTANDVAGGIRSAAQLTATYADATTAKIVLIAGKAVGAAYTSFALADLVIATNSAQVSPIEPTAAATVIFSKELSNTQNIVADTEKFAKMYIEQFCNQQALEKSGLADICCSENEARKAVADALEILSTKRTTRYPKKYGAAI